MVDEGLLFRTNEDAFVKTKRKLLDECDLWCIVSLPGGRVHRKPARASKPTCCSSLRASRPGRIWYYDLSEVKVAKKKPFTLAHFDEFFRLLPERGDSAQSWTVDFAARKRHAAEQATPLHEQARQKRQEAARCKERLEVLRIPDRQDRDWAAIEQAEHRMQSLVREARELASKAEAIENAVYDLKAVNPHKTLETDARTPAELLDLIEAKGREIAEALAVLRNLEAPRA